MCSRCWFPAPKMYALPTNQRMKVMRFAHAVWSTREISGMESVGRGDRERYVKKEGRKEKRAATHIVPLEILDDAPHALFGATIEVQPRARDSLLFFFRYPLVSPFFRTMYFAAGFQPFVHPRRRAPCEKDCITAAKIFRPKFGLRRQREEGEEATQRETFSFMEN